MHKAVLGNENKQRMSMYYSVHCLGSSLASEWLSQPFYRWRWDRGRQLAEIQSCSDKEKADWLWWERRGFLICVALSEENFFPPLLLALPTSINRFCLCLSCVEGSQTGSMPSLIGMCHSVEGKSNRWPFLASTLPPALINTFICILSLWLWLLPLLSPFLLESH